VRNERDEANRRGRLDGDLKTGNAKAEHGCRV
jgi:hypothetical protein